MNKKTEQTKKITLQKAPLWRSAIAKAKVWISAWSSDENRTVGVLDLQEAFVLIGVTCMRAAGSVFSACLL